ncbi:AMP-binding protein [Pseudohongiella sp. SYSU M77423]|uniref:AMP-binding protein n=1 Tax=unclassified Pseudohongiella TaxID=2629611 RepID=UPI001F365131|nr:MULTISPECIES: AMP-binding protein [unclassified Pseudohongiella]MDH7944520.1 AMP-binding protein [Pseudohongiella sp. SYSU M77423]
MQNRLLTTADHDRTAESETLPGLLRCRTASEPEKLIYTFLNADLKPECQITLSGLLEQSQKLACGMQRIGLKGTRVGLIYTHGPEFVQVFWASVLAGVTPVPMTKPRGTSWTGMAALLSKHGVRAVLTGQTLAALIKVDHVPVYTLQSLLEFSHEQPQLELQSPQASDVAFIQFTSGSTSQPKGVAISHSNILANVRQISSAFQCNRDDVGLSWLPFHHDMGLIGHVIQPVYAGIHNYFLSPKTFVARPLKWLAAIDKYRVTISGAPSFAYRRCLQQISQSGQLDTDLDLSCWRLAYCGSERVSYRTLREFLIALRRYGMQERALFPCYGLAEATLFVSGVQGLKADRESLNKRDDQAVAVGSSSRVIKVVDTVRRRCCEDGQEGEIWVKSASVARGYTLETESDGRVFGQKLNDVSGRFLRTGDRGYFRAGLLYVTGRENSVLKVRGRPLCAEFIEGQVEHRFTRHGIGRCAAVAVNCDGCETLGLVLESTRAIASLDLHRIVSFVLELTGVAPEGAHVLSSGRMPLTTSGKIKRDQCRSLMQSLLDKEVNCA